MTRPELLKLTHRKVVVDLTVRLTVSVPEDWGQDMIEFWLNESSHCLRTEFDTVAEELEAVPETQCGFCHRSRGRYVREATGDEHDDHTLGDDLPTAAASSSAGE